MAIQKYNSEVGLFNIKDKYDEFKPFYFVLLMLEASVTKHLYNKFRGTLLLALERELEKVNLIKLKDLKKKARQIKKSYTLFRKIERNFEAKKDIYSIFNPEFERTYTNEAFNQASEELLMASIEKLLS